MVMNSSLGFNISATRRKQQSSYCGYEFILLCRSNRQKAPRSGSYKAKTCFQPLGIAEAFTALTNVLPAVLGNS